MLFTGLDQWTFDELSNYELHSVYTKDSWAYPLSISIPLLFLSKNFQKCDKNMIALLICKQCWIKRDYTLEEHLTTG